MVGIILKREDPPCHRSNGTAGQCESPISDFYPFQNEDANTGVLVRLANVAVEGFEIEGQLTDVFGLELINFQFDGDQTLKPTVEQQQIDGEVAFANLDRILFADEAEVPAAQ